jgi:hypothetical protein
MQQAAEAQQEHLEVAVVVMVDQAAVLAVQILTETLINLVEVELQDKDLMVVITLVQLVVLLVAGVRVMQEETVLAVLEEMVQHILLILQ